MGFQNLNESKTYIVVVESGWVFVGVPTQQEGTLKLDKAQNLRVWGTQDGLGQIALGGPTKETVLDNYGVVVIPDSKILYIIPCEF